MPKFFAWPSIRSEKAKLRDTIETVRILAGMAKFFVADLFNPQLVVLAGPLSELFLSLRMK
jgi:hypothetical protein